MEITPGGQAQPKYNLEELPYIECENSECKSTQFKEVVLFKKVSRLLTGSTQDSIVPIPTFVCAKCGHLNEIFKPKV